MNWTTSKSKATEDNAFAANIAINFLRPDAARTYFFCAKTWKRHTKNKWMARPGLNTGNFWNVLPMKTPISLTNQRHITKTCLYSFDPLKPHFYIVKLRFTGVYIIFLISAQNIDWGYSLELPHWGGSNKYPQSIEAVLTSTHNLCFEQKYEKYQNFLSAKFSFWGGKIFSIFE